MNQPNIDLTQSSEVLSSTGGQIFATGYVLRRISKFLTATPDDIIVPVQIMYDPLTMEIVSEMLDPEIRHFYQNKNENIIQ